MRSRPTMLERLDRTCCAHRPKPVRNREFGNTRLVSIALQEVRERRELPGCFPFWTAEKHGFDALLTLEKKLPRLITRVQAEKAIQIQINTAVLRPLELLAAMGISEPDRVPIDRDRFYNLYEG